MPNPIRILLLGDTHLGVTPASRGEDFARNYLTALEPALNGEVDVVIHLGDVFDHPRIKPAVAYSALKPLVRIADRGTPVLIVPGNHERSQLQHARFASHPRIHVFDRPRTFLLDIRSCRVAVAGFPFERNVRAQFRRLLEATGYQREDADCKVLCLHQCVEGAKVGPADFTFTNARDVIRARDIPGDLAAVLSGHIHRHQILPLAAPVIYPGSTERTAFAEMKETKGFMILELPELQYEFRELRTRPMCFERLCADGFDAEELEQAIRKIVRGAPVDAVLRIRVTGDVPAGAQSRMTAAHLRTFVPRSMSIEIRTDAVEAFRAAQRQRQRERPSLAPAQLDLSI